MRRHNLRESIYSTSILIIIVSLFLVTVCCVPAEAWTRHDNAYSGQWQDTGTGWWYRYTTGTDTEEWNYSGKMRFAYQWNVGQWWTFGGDAWSRLGLGNVAPVYLMDGNYHDLRNGWWFQYTVSNDTSLWNDSGKLRFSFQYSVRQWWDCGNVWGRIGVANGYSAFVGDGAYHDMRNGWWYRYTTGTDTEEWNYSGKMRFAYQWNVGQWWTFGGDAWSRLGLGNVSSSYIMDGNYHDLRNGWWYQYILKDDTSLWNDSGKLRFAYQYDVRQWWDCGNVWGRIGVANGYSAFVGDGAYHDMRNGWWYCYNTSNDTAQWNYSGKTRLALQYNVGQWWNHGNVGDWWALGAAGRATSFIGDGGWHQMDSIWSYQYKDHYGYLRGYVSTPNGASWSVSTDQQYRCNYSIQVLGLFDNYGTSSVCLYDYVLEGAYNTKWTASNYTISDKTLISKAIVFYTGSTTRDVSSWLYWLPVAPKPGCITRTETWDYSNKDWDNRYNHEVRAFGNNMWVVQREQGDYANCGIIASIDSFSSFTGNYVGWTKSWHDVAIAKGWATYNVEKSKCGLMTAAQTRDLINYMATIIPGSGGVNATWGLPSNRSLENLLGLVKNGGKVNLFIDLRLVSEFGNFVSPEVVGHVVCLVGDLDVGYARYAQITNGWEIRSDTTQLVGEDPKWAFPITNIPWSKMVQAYYAYSRI